MTLDVGFVADVQAKLVAELVPPPVVRVVAVPHGVEIEPAESIDQAANDHAAVRDDGGATSKRKGCVFEVPKSAKNERAWRRINLSSVARTKNPSITCPKKTTAGSNLPIRNRGADPIDQRLFFPSPPKANDAAF